MKIEIRASGGDACECCGSFPVVFVPSSNRHLEAELAAVFKQGAPWYRPFKRASYRRVEREIARLSGELRGLTVKGIG